MGFSFPKRISRLLGGFEEAYFTEHGVGFQRELSGSFLNW
jgi:hypothetical protein